MVWYGTVWYGTVCYGVVWYSTVWCSMVWSGTVLYGVGWYCAVRYGMVWYNSTSRLYKQKQNWCFLKISQKTCCSSLRQPEGIVITAVEVRFFFVLDWSIDFLPIFYQGFFLFLEVHLNSDIFQFCICGYISYFVPVTLNQKAFFMLVGLFILWLIYLLRHP